MAPISVLGMAPANSCSGSTLAAEPLLRPAAAAAVAVFCCCAAAVEAMAGLLLLLSAPDGACLISVVLAASCGCTGLGASWGCVGALGWSGRAVRGTSRWRGGGCALLCAGC